MIYYPIALSHVSFVDLSVAIADFPSPLAYSPFPLGNQAPFPCNLHTQEAV